MQQIGLPFPGSQDTFATAINDNGTIVGGHSQHNEGPGGGHFQELGYVRYPSGLLREITSPDPIHLDNTWAADCNNADLVVGSLFEPLASHRPIQYDSSGTVQVLDNAVFVIAQANSVNASGTIVGNRNGLGFVFKNGGFLDLQPLPLGQGTNCYAWAVNDSGIIAGGSIPLNDHVQGQRATFWLGGGMPNDLNSVVTNLWNWRLNRAAAR